MENDRLVDKWREGFWMDWKTKRLKPKRPVNEQIAFQKNTYEDVPQGVIVTCKTKQKKQMLGERP